MGVRLSDWFTPSSALRDGSVDRRTQPRPRSVTSRRVALPRADATCCRGRGHHESRRRFGHVLRTDDAHKQPSTSV
jgi:hypothetical protein